MREEIASWISRARDDRAYLGELLERYRPYLRVIAESLLNARLAVRCDAADVVQQTLAKAVEGFDAFRGTTEPEFSAWLARIHSNQIRDVARRNLGAQRRSIENEVPLELPGGAALCWGEPAANQATPSQQLIQGEKALRLAATLDLLPEGQREAVRMRYIDCWEFERIAAEMRRSISAVQGLIKRGLQALRLHMHEDSWG